MALASAIGPRQRAGCCIELKHVLRCFFYGGALLLLSLCGLGGWYTSLFDITCVGPNTLSGLGLAGSSAPDFLEDRRVTAIT